ncbi:hypothetical protein ABLE94_00510 [Gordonia sp. VNK1]|uniref:hypothetical protein n=1 Tax=Gordonia oleivorans TaxID=3156618 RepID=UPI0032B5EC52
MATATPQTLDALGSQLLAEIQKSTDAQREELNEIFRQAGDLTDQAHDLLDGARDALDDLVSDPDWFSLLLFLVVRLSALDDHLTVGAMQPPGWSPMITLTYTVDAQAAATLGVAPLTHTDDAGNPLSRGVFLRIHKDVTANFPVAGGIGLSLAAHGAGQWTFAFGKPLGKPMTPATVAATLFWDPPDLTATPVTLTTGRAAATVHLNSQPAAGAKPYALTIALGDATTPATAGMRAHIDLGSSLGVLSEVISIATIDEQYSPTYTRPAAGPPTFDLHHRSA